MPARSVKRPVDCFRRLHSISAFLGIGENGHLAFNDPPADFQTTAPYAIVQLDETCRRQQVGEGWFATLEDVPTTAVSMTIPQMLSAHELLVIVPDRRKAAAVQAALTGPVSPMVPASILQTHPNVTVFLDRDAASALRPGSDRSGQTGVRRGSDLELRGLTPGLTPV